MSFFDDDPRREVGHGRLNFSLEPLLGITPFVVQRAAASATLVLTTSLQDVVGAVLTLVFPGVYMIVGVFSMNGDVASNDDTLTGILDVDGASEDSLAISHGDVDKITVSQVWFYTKTTLGSTVVKLRARKTSGSGASQVDTVHTTITAMTVPGSQDVT